MQGKSLGYHDLSWEDFDHTLPMIANDKADFPYLKFIVSASASNPAHPSIDLKAREVTPLLMLIEERRLVDEEIRRIVGNGEGLSHFIKEAAFSLALSEKDDLQQVLSVGNPTTFNECAEHLTAEVLEKSKISLDPTKKGRIFRLVQSSLCELVLPILDHNTSLVRQPIASEQASQEIFSVEEAVSLLQEMHRFFDENAELMDFYPRFQQERDSFLIFMNDLMQKHSVRPDSATLSQLQFDLENAETAFALLKKKVISLKDDLNQLQLLKDFIAAKIDPVDDKMLLHILGDHFGKNTKLEGNDPFLILSYNHSFLKQYIKHFSGDEQSLKELSQLAKQIEEAMSIDKAVCSYKVDALRKLMKSKLENLKTDETLFFPGGWVDAFGGHAMFYEFRKQANGKYVFRMYNKGEGVHFHPSAVIGNDTLYAPYVEKTEVPLEGILNPLWLQILCEFQTEVTADPWNSSHVYNILFGMLEGEIPDRPLQVEDLRKPQLSGTCSYMSFRAAADPKLSNYFVQRQAQFQVEFKTLVKFADMHSKYLAFNERAIALLNKTLAAFALNAKKAHDDGIINDFEMEFAAAKIAEIRHIVDQAEWQYLEILADRAPWVSTEDRIDDFFTLPHLSQRVSFKLIQPTASLQTPHLFSHQAEIKSWKPELETLVQDLTQFSSLFEKAHEEQDYPFVIEGMKELMWKLPLEWKDQEGNDRWRQLDDQSKLKLFSLIAKFSNLACDSRIRSCGLLPTVQSGFCEHSLYLAHYKAFYLGYHLLDSMVESQPVARYGFKIDKLPKLHLMDPQLEEEYLAARAFAEKADSFSSFDDLCKCELNQVMVQPTGGIVDPKQFLQTPFYPWIAEKIKDPEVRIKLASRFPNWNAMDDIDQALVACAEKLVLDKDIQNLAINRDILPSYYYEMNDLKSVLSFLTFVSMSPDALQETKGVARSCISYFPATRQFVSWLKGPGSSQNNFSSLHLRQGEGSLYLSDEFPMSEEIEFQFFLLTEDLQSHRTLTTVGDEPLYCIEQLLSYYSSHPELLAKLVDQSLFEDRLYNSGILLKQLSPDNEANAELVAEMFAHFMQKLLTTHCQRKSFEGAAFALRCSDRIKHYLSYINPGLFEKVIDHFPNTSQVVKEIFNREHHIDENEQSLLKRAVVLSYQGKKSLLPEEIEELILEGMLIGTLRLKETLQHAMMEKLILDVMQEHSKEFKAYFEKENPSSILNRLVDRMYGESSQRKWKLDPSFPCFGSEDGVYKVNLITSSISANSAQATSLPKEIYLHPDFKNFFQESVIKNIGKLNHQTYMFLVDETPYRIIFNSCYLKIQKPININGETVWGQLEEGAKILIKNEALHALYKLPWVLDKSPAEFILENPSTKQLCHLTLARDNYTIKSICQVDSYGFDTSLILAYIISSVQTPWTFLNNIAPYQQMLLWKHETTHELQQIDLPFLTTSGLSFSLQRTRWVNRMASEQYPGFFIAHDQYTPEMIEDPLYLLLENDKGEQIALLPKQSLINSHVSKGSLDKSRITLEEQQAGSYQFYDVLAYPLDRMSGALIFQNDDARFYLALRHLARMDYEEANRLLRGHESFLRPYNEDEKETLQMILKMPTKLQDHDPRAIALSLYAGYLLLKDNVPDIGVRELYIEYLSKLEFLHSCHLTPEEELKIIKILGANDQVVKNRENILKSETIELKTPEITPTSSNEILYTSYGEDFTWVINQVCFQNNSAVTPNKKTFLKTPFTTTAAKEAYKLVKGEYTSDKDIANAFKTVTGMALQNLADWKAELITVLNLKYLTLYRRTDAQKLFIVLLQAVLEKPELFPAFADLENNTRKTKISSSLKEAIKNVLPLRRPFGSRLIEGKKLPLTSSQPAKAANPPIEPRLLKLEDTNIESTVIPVEETSGISQIFYDASEEPTEDPIEKEICAVFNLDIPVLDNVIVKEFKNVQKSIKAYFATAESVGPTSTLSDNRKFKQFAASMRYQHEGLKETLEYKRMRLESLANVEPSDRYSQSLNVLNVEGASRASLTIYDLVQLFWRRDATLFKEANPHLSDSDIEWLMADIQDYLVYATKMQKYGSIADKADSILTALNEGLAENEIDRQLSLLEKEAEMEREYSISRYPEYLVLEYFMGIQLRPEQIANLDKLQLKDGKIGNEEALGVVLEMIMGAGKTSVLLPLLGLLNADGDRLSMGIIPESLFPSVAKEMESALGNGFKRSVQVIEVRRQTIFDQRSLEELLDKLNQIRSKRQMLLMTDSSVQCLYLKFIEHQYRLTHAQDELTRAYLQKEVDLFKEIFKLFKDKGHIIIDEVDLVFNPRKEHHFTLGEPTQLKKYELDLTAGLETVLATHPDIRKNMQTEFLAPIQGQQAPPFTQKLYLKEVAPRLIQEMLDKNFFQKDPELKAFFSKLSADERRMIAQFIANSDDATVLKFVASIDSSEIKDILALAREQIHVLLPLTMDKVCSVHYGPKAESDIAIPYHGSKNPAIKSQFGVPFETLNYTMQMCLKEGIKRETLQKAVTDLRKKADLEASAASGRDFTHTKAYKAFLSLCEGDESFSFYLTDIDQLLSKINGKPELTISFARDYIMPQITSYPVTISANPHIFSFLFNKVYGFSGTQWNIDTFPDTLKAFQDETITGKTLALLWQHSKDKVHEINLQDPHKLFDELIGQHPELHHITGILDSAGYARGIDNLTLAKTILNHECYRKRIPPLNGVVFYDNEDRKMMLERGKDPIPLSESSIPPEEYITFWDQKHTTGSNIKQTRKAVALMTISKHTILRDLLQSVWRLRGLDKEQKIEFAIDIETRDLIKERIKELTGAEIVGGLKFEHILLYVVHNQAMLQGDNNYRAMKQKMWSIIQAEAMKAMLEAPDDPNITKELFDDVKTLFVKESLSSAWEIYGNKPEEVPAKTAVEKDKERIRDALALRFLTERFGLDVSKIKQDIEKMAQNTLSILPAKLMTTSVDNRHGTEVEIEKEKEKETEKELENETERAIANDENDRQPKNYIEIVDALAQSWPHVLIYAIDQAFDHDDDMKVYQGIFDPHLISTPNFQTICDTPPKKIFGYYQRQTAGIAVLRDVATGELRISLISQKDNARLREKKWKSKTTQCCIYDFQLGMCYQKTEFDTAILKSPEFLQLLVQAKFFDGVTDYTADELPYLEGWIKEKGVEQMRTLFETHILAFKSRNRQTFKYSILHDLFAKLIAS